MRNKKHFIVAACLLAGWFLAAAPYATVSYAEGTSFTLIRNNKPVVYKLAQQDVFGMELIQGDIIQTGSATFLEISIHPIAASVQIAENTSFRCDGNASGTQSAGELYYGRVRAKVSKLSGDSSYRISSPSLVAGVRGTDFGLDVLVQRAVKDESGAVTSPVLHRVFCFDGSVLVSETAASLTDSAAAPVILATGEMVEKVVVSQAVLPGAVPSATLLNKLNIADEVRNFWRAKKSVGYVAPASEAVADASAEDTGKVYTDGEYTVTERTLPQGVQPVQAKRNLKVPNAVSFILLGAGTFLCAGTAIYSDRMHSDSWFVKPGYTTGVVLIGSGTILAITSMLFD